MFAHGYICVWLCVWRLEIAFSHPRTIKLHFTSISVHSFLFPVSGSLTGWVFPSRLGRLASLRDLPFSAYQVSKYAPALFRWVLGIKPQLPGVREEHFAN